MPTVISETVIELSDASPVEGTTRVKVQVENGNLALAIAPEGYGCFGVDGDCAPVLLERYEGRMRLLVWANREQEDPTHIIDLEGARHD